ncbi:DgyrCDS3897 [Dimorphilus gyrociliatus]|uniref:DgyrCDS3897 n=1 Tax=Dimorphilus gyrociliatus TaxID=2664684 RepID=A0A7I8VGS4_9ANNE|nr:DgyrCDS3897 [Dimorphilus gyrociliatus]
MKLFLMILGLVLFVQVLDARSVPIDDELYDGNSEDVYVHKFQPVEEKEDDENEIDSDDVDIVDNDTEVENEDNDTANEDEDEDEDEDEYDGDEEDYEEDNDDEEEVDEKPSHGLSDVQVKSICKKYRNGEINVDKPKTKKFLMDLCKTEEEDTCQYRYGKWCLDGYIKGIRRMVSKIHERMGQNGGQSGFNFGKRGGCKRKHGKHGKHGKHRKHGKHGRHGKHGKHGKHGEPDQQYRQGKYQSRWRLSNSNDWNSHKKWYM